VTDDAILEVQDLRRYFPVKSGVLGRTSGVAKVLDGISFHVNRRETLGIVGESGSGKTMLLRTILRLVEPTSGKVILEGKDLTAMGNEELRQARRQMQLVFQDPLGSLHPRMTIEQSLMEPFVIHGVGDKAERQERVKNLLTLVGLNPDWRKRYPHQFSGGQRQRIGVARALALQPKLILADEPVSALDVSLQAQVLNLILDLQDEFHLTYVFVAHDLAVLRQICDRIAVLYLGKIVELAPSDAIYENPLHPCTKALLAASPSIEAGLEENGTTRLIARGEVPDPTDPPSGCPFHPRCPLAFEPCPTVVPQLIEVEPGHWVSCHLVTPP
jgi:oligopeptide/dipeptide ABC transporter ATP-binding protein